MNRVGRTINSREPSFGGPDGIVLAVKQHFSYIRGDSHPYIVFFIEELIKSVPFESKLIETSSGARFKIGEITFYSKKGNLHLEVPKNLMGEVKQVADNIFIDTEVSPQGFHYDDLTLVIRLKSLGWH